MASRMQIVIIPHLNMWYLHQMIKKLIEKTRSCRRFMENRTIDINTLEDLVDSARLSASAANLQPLKYFLVTDRKRNSEIFPLLGWAGYLKDWAGPAEGERPSAYIVVLGDTEICSSFDCDLGIALQSMSLFATEKGFAGCIIASFQKEKLAAVLDLPQGLTPLAVLALGEPVEKIVLEEMSPDGSIKYWRDDEGVHHVPKRPLDLLIIGRAGV